MDVIQAEFWIIHTWLKSLKFQNGGEQSTNVEFEATHTNSGKFLFKIKLE